MDPRLLKPQSGRYRMNRAFLRLGHSRPTDAHASLDAYTGRPHKGIGPRTRVSSISANTARLLLAHPTTSASETALGPSALLTDPNDTPTLLEILTVHSFLLPRRRPSSILIGYMRFPTRHRAKIQDRVDPVGTVMARRRWGNRREMEVDRGVLTSSSQTHPPLLGALSLVSFGRHIPLQPEHFITLTPQAAELSQCPSSSRRLSPSTGFVYDPTAPLLHPASGHEEGEYP
ncbi:hypothetical protein FB45DRAFT_1113700 [Roridomyces roridus]|uniref:Uncharacterized protein n=1 Tax=Roridomyces roridus TaxID=1738132 RepID=A0AAD7CA14_9AGAR|nr:hypothetical protein FB45DRAFT_1113700 [Roridomyces roridus]